MSLTFDELEGFLTKIFTGIEFTTVKDKVIVFRHPDNLIKQRANFVQDKSFEDAKKQGLLPSKDLEALIEKRNLIPKEEIERLKKLKSQLEAQEVLLSKTTRVKANQDRIKEIILKIRTEIREIEYKRNSKLLMSAETKAEEDKTFFICSQCSSYEDGTLVWPSYEAALKETDLEFKDLILLNYVRFYGGLPTRIIRQIARSSVWRIRYVNSMKTSEPLLGVPASNYDINQINLVYWSNFYQNIYEMMPEDRPSDMVIDDDDSLDAYMKAYYEERTREDAARRSKAKTPGKLSAFDAEEVIVTRANELYQDIEYDTPREAQKLKERTDIRKKTRRR
jgi:hypothetical protein